MILTHELTLFSEGGFYALNITDPVQAVVDASGVKEGLALVFYRHTTGALLVAEHEAGILVDFEDALERIAPSNAEYQHHRRGYDRNGSSHLRAGLLSVSITLPIRAGRLMLGEFQELLALDMDAGAKARNVVVQVMGE